MQLPLVSNNNPKKSSPEGDIDLGQIRSARFYQSPRSPGFSPSSQSDLRTPFERDRDRILYTNELRRLAGITQVAKGELQTVVHNRLTHVLEVAQVGKGLADQLLRLHETTNPTLKDELDPSVVEAACLAHDIGHPPFGHVAEEELDVLAHDKDLIDGFEGNAQSFRIVTKLIIRRKDCPGLNLTRATLGALLKYPWHRETSGKKKKKWGAYHTESGEFKWARELGNIKQYEKTLEAEIMDWADDVAFSVHDVEDFYEVGLVPLGQLSNNDDARREFLDFTFRRWEENEDDRLEDKDNYENVFNELLHTFPIEESYNGKRAQRSHLRTWTSSLIERFICAATINRMGNDSRFHLNIENYAKFETTILKQLTWHYVILNPSLATEHYGHRQIIRQLFKVFHEAIRDKKKRALLPMSVLDGLDERLDEAEDRDEEQVRTVIDLIAGLTEQQAIAIHQRVTGQYQGSGTQTIFL